MSVNESLRPLTINISPAFDRQGVRRHGLFFADLDGPQLCIYRHHLLDAARVLIKEGIDPATPIATRHAGAGFDAKTSTVEAAARWTVREDDKVGPIFVRWRAFSRCDVEALVRFDERSAPDTGQGRAMRASGHASGGRAVS